MTSLCKWHQDIFSGKIAFAFLGFKVALTHVESCSKLCITLVQIINTPEGSSSSPLHCSFSPAGNSRQRDPKTAMMRNFAKSARHVSTPTNWHSNYRCEPPLRRHLHQMSGLDNNYNGLASLFFSCRVLYKLPCLHFPFHSAIEVYFSQVPVMMLNVHLTIPESHPKLISNAQSEKFFRVERLLWG